MRHYFHCDKCTIDFLTDLDQSEVKYCLYCGQARPFLYQTEKHETPEPASAELDKKSEAYKAGYLRAKEILEKP
jgi:hypothetical protein